MKTLTFDPFVADAPHIDQWCGTWLMEPESFSTLVRLVENADLMTHLASIPGEQAALSRGSDGYNYAVVSDGVAHIEVRGTMMKHRASMMASASTVELRRDLRALANDDQVEAVLMTFETPGGTAAGTPELAAEIIRLAESKPVTAFVEDLAASAGYWAACCATEVYANDLAKIGSIGTYTVVSDFSGMAAKEGIKVHLITTGEFKGAGTPGTEVTPAHLAEWQRIVDGINERFLAGVSQGRKMPMEQVRQLADGRVHLAAEAVQLGLIDGVKSFDEVVAMVGGRKPTPKRRTKRMSESQAATIGEIESACPGISTEKAVAFLKGEKTIEQCRSSWMQELATENAVLQEQIQTLTKERDDAKAEAEKAKKAPGVDAIEEASGSAGGGGESATEAFNQIVATKMKSGLPRHKAVLASVRENRELHSRMIEEANA